jgi:uncharacterized protein YggE
MPGGESLIEVSAVGEVSVAPDRLGISIGVRVSRPQPGAALEDLSARIAALQAVLDALAVPPEDRQTSELNLHPDRPGRTEELEHVASSSFEIMVNDFDMATAVLARAADVVGDALTVSGLRWTVNDPTAALRAARHQAVATATATAQQLAEDAGVTLGPIRFIREPPSGGQPARVKFFGAAQRSRGGGPALEAGESRLSVAVEMAWTVA